MMMHFFIVGLGGALGAMMRHGAGLLAVRVLGSGFPWGTLTVNILGSLAIGLMTGVLALMSQWSQEVRLFVVVGILGGFTTFSAFSLDTLLLIERGQVVQAISYVVGSFGFSLLAAGLGLLFIRMVSP